MSRTARSPCSRSGSARCQRRLDLVPPGPTTAGDVHGCGCIQPSQGGTRRTGPDETWHIDTTVIRLLDGTRAYLHAVSTTSLDGFWRGAWLTRSHRSTAWPCWLRPVGARRASGIPVVLADAGVETWNAQVDELIETGVLRRVWPSRS